MNHTEQRKKFRAVLNGKKCLLGASLVDPLSARIAEAIGYEIGMLGGSVAAYAELAAPDLCVMTLTELTNVVRRIMRVSNLSLLVDADHGYGNALNVMRTVQELEHAGVSGLMIEDTVMPLTFGQDEDTFKLVSVEEMVGKLRAALAAREDPTLTIAARIAGLKAEDTERTVARAKIYEKTGVDAIYLTGLKKVEDLDAISAAVKIPLIVSGGARVTLRLQDLEARGICIHLQGHQPVAAAVKAIRETYTHLFNGGAPADLKGKIASNEEMESLVNADSYRKWQREFLR